MAEFNQNEQIEISLTDDNLFVNAQKEVIGKLVSESEVQIGDDVPYYKEIGGKVYDNQGNYHGLVDNGFVRDGMHTVIGILSESTSTLVGVAMLGMLANTSKGIPPMPVTMPKLFGRIAVNPVKVIVSASKKVVRTAGRAAHGIRDDKEDEDSFWNTVMPMLVFFGLTCGVFIFAVVFVIAAVLTMLMLSPLWGGVVVCSLIAANRMIRRYSLRNTDFAGEWKSMRLHYAIKRNALMVGLLYGAIVSVVVTAFSRQNPENAFITIGVTLFGLIVAAGFVDRYAIWLLAKFTTRAPGPAKPSDLKVASLIEANGVKIGAVAASLLVVVGLFGFYNTSQKSREAQDLQTRTAAVSNSTTAPLAGTPTLPPTTSSQVTTPSPDSPSAANAPNTNAPANTSEEFPKEHFPQTHTHEMTDTEVDAMGYPQVRYAINEVYARHGAEFQTGYIRKQFETMPWYKAVPGRKADAMDQYLSPIELANMKKLGKRKALLISQGKDKE